MTTAREELHHLVDAVDDNQVAEATALLRGLTEPQPQPDRRLSFVGSLTGGAIDLAERHEDYLREHFRSA